MIKEAVKSRDSISSYLKVGTRGGWETLWFIYFVPMSIFMLIYICLYVHIRTVYPNALSPRPPFHSSSLLLLFTFFDNHRKILISKLPPLPFIKGPWPLIRNVKALSYCGGIWKNKVYYLIFNKWPKRDKMIFLYHMLGISI